ncbi:MAG: hypothetical protein IJY06_02745 [Oscillospiraceae bacterium]|nr:hypothetical protein [Oscillospiraceae bacterium]MBQ8011083.1 hypothetical protein [Oscillospiraceae bacterium]MBQ9110272.1 hypothetical protein [Oscillospiraceae bacterium]
MNKRAFKFILALTTLTVLVWGVGELLIAEFINSYKVSVGWGIFCLIACLAYSVWKCPWDTGGNDQEEK